MSLAHRITLLAAPGVKGRLGILFRFWKMRLVKFSLQSSITTVTLNRSSSLISAALEIYDEWMIQLPKKSLDS